MPRFFYCTMTQTSAGNCTYSNGIVAMEYADIEVLRRTVAEGLAREEIHVKPEKIVILAFNEV